MIIMALTNQIYLWRSTEFVDFARSFGLKLGNAVATAWGLTYCKPRRNETI